MKVAAIDDAPECPPALGYLWRDFCQLSMGLGSNGMGPAVVTWESLRAWSAFMGVALEPWEVRTLVELGLKRAQVEAEDIRKETRRNAGRHQDRQHRA